MTPSESRHSERGFTLVEVLIATSISAMLMILVVSSMRFGIRADQQANNYLQQTQQMVLAHRTLRNLIQHAYPQLVMSRDRHFVADFFGQHDSIRFATLSKTGTPEHMQINVTPDEGGRSLTVTPPQGKSRPLIRNALAISFSYLPADADAGGKPPQWQQEWRDRYRLPALIKIEVTASNNEKWPALIIHPQIEVDTDCVYDSLTGYCKGRR